MRPQAGVEEQERQDLDSFGLRWCGRRESRRPAARKNQHGIGWRGTDLVANPASRAGVGHDHWNSILGLHRARDGTALDADAAKRSVGEAESPLNDGDTVLWFWGSGGRGRWTGFADGCFNDSFGGLGWPAQSSPKEGEQAASGKAGTHFDVTVLATAPPAERARLEVDVGRSLAAAEKTC